MIDDALDNWVAALDQLDLSDAEKTQQLTVVGELVMSKLLRQVATQHSGVQPDKLVETFGALSATTQAKLLSGALQEALAVYAAKVEELYSTDIKDRFVAALSM